MFKTLSATPLSIFWLFSFVISVFFATDAHAQQANFVKYDTPMQLPSILLKDVNGRETTLKTLLSQKAKNGIVLLHLWTPSCGTCIKEIMDIDKAKAALEAKGMPILSLAEDPRGNVTVPAFIRRQDIGSDGIYIDQGKKAMKSLRSPGVPVTYIVSKDGQALAQHVGAMSW